MDLRAEIDHLTALNRVDPDPSRETELIRLRRRDFASSDPVEPATWPPPWADPQPGSRDAVCEIDADELTVDVLGGALLHHPCLIVRGLLDRGTSEEFVHGIDQVFRARELYLEGVEDESTTSWYNPPALLDGEGKKKGEAFAAHQVLRTVYSPRMTFRVIEAYERVGVGDLVAGYLGERPAVSGNKWSLRRMQPNGGVPGDFHQDGAFLGSGVRSVNLWIALNDCGVTSPGLDVVAKDFRRVLESGTHGAVFEWTVSEQRARELGGDEAILHLEFGAGDAVFFDEMLLHRTGQTAAMTQPRYALESWFFSPSHYPDEHIALAY